MKPTAWRLLVLMLTMGGLIWAADEEAGRGVARISLINGDVSVRRGDSGEWVAAALNAPLVVEDTIVAGANSHAEVQFDWANMIRLSENTEVKLAELENQRYIVQVARGLATFRVQRDSDADVEISTPSVSVRPIKQGSYRIVVRESGESEITVRSGEAEIYTPQGSERLRSGRTMIARGTASDPEFQVVSAVGRDDWDRWNDDRDHYFERTASYRYVDRSVYGADDLDGYGTWSEVEPYGWVWSPRVEVGWSPYYYGRWSWMDWYGWNWVSYDPWGWAPYHYGRWFNQGSRWCWWPGEMHRRHDWSPGQVAFFGWGGWNGVHVGVGIGHLGWVPLAPHEAYYPWYGRGYYRGYRNGTYIDNSVTIVNNTNIVNAYRNARVRGGITGVDAGQFGRGGPGNYLRVSDNDMRRADLVRGQLPVAPNRESLRVSDRQVVNARSVAANERFFSRRTPATVDRVPFEQQQRSMEQTRSRAFGGSPAARPADNAGTARGAAMAPAARGEAPVMGQGTRERQAPAASVQDRSSEGGWRRFGSGATTPDAPARTMTPRPAESPRVAPSAPQSGDSGGWRRFEPNREAAPQARERISAPQSSERSMPSRQVESPQAAPERRAEPMRINPPIVRQREAPARVEAPRAPSGGGGGGGSVVRESPRSSGGAGGGGGRSDGGGRVSSGGGRNR